MLHKSVPFREGKVYFFPHLSLSFNNYAYLCASCTSLTNRCIDLCNNLAVSNLGAGIAPVPSFSLDLFPIGCFTTTYGCIASYRDCCFCRAVLFTRLYIYPQEMYQNWQCLIDSGLAKYEHRICTTNPQRWHNIAEENCCPGCDLQASGCTLYGIFCTFAPRDIHLLGREVSNCATQVPGASIVSKVAPLLQSFHLAFVGLCPIGCAFRRAGVRRVRILRNRPFPLFYDGVDDLAVCPVYYGSVQQGEVNPSGVF